MWSYVPLCAVTISRRKTEEMSRNLITRQNYDHRAMRQSWHFVPQKVISNRFRAFSAKSRPVQTGKRNQKQRYLWSSAPGGGNGAKSALFILKERMYKWTFKMSRPYNEYSEKFQLRNL